MCEVIPEDAKRIVWVYKIESRLVIRVLSREGLGDMFTDEDTVGSYNPDDFSLADTIKVIERFSDAV